MKIDLTWKNRNTLDTGVRIYRANAAFDRSTLPAPLVTLDRTALTYSDTDVVRNGMYYYRIEHFNTNDSALSNLIPMLAQAYTGPGPQTLMHGNMDLGYYGEIPATSLFLGDALATACGVTAGSVVNNATVTWLKFAYKGKILFIPRVSIRDNVDWLSLYQAGVVFGAMTVTAAMLPVGVSSTPLPQNKIVTKDSDSFVVRLMTGSGTAKLPLTFAANAAFSSKQYLINSQNCEYMELLVRASSFSTPEQVGQNFDNFKENQLFEPGTSVSGALTGSTLCLELGAASGTILIRGAKGGATDGIINIATGGNAAYAQVSTYNGYSSGQIPHSWRPVLELVLS